MAGKIIIPLLSQFDAAGIKQAISSIEKLGSSVGGLKGVLGGLAGFNVGSSIFGFIGDSVDQAKLLQGQMMALDTVFGKNNKEIQDFIANSEKLALSHQEAAQAATFLGTNLKSAGFPMGEVTKKTEKLLKLAADLAITYGYPVQEALTATAAMFRGEYDPIEKFGVAIKQSQVNAVLLQNGLGKLKGQALLNAATMVRYNLLMSHSKDAQGAMARQSDTLVVKQAKLEKAFKDQQAALGTALLPALTDVASKFLHMANGIAPSLEASFKTLATIIGNLFEGFKTSLPILGMVGGLFSGIAGFAGHLAEALSSVSAQFLAALAIGVGLKKLVPVFSNMRAYWDEFGLAVTAGANRIQATATKVGAAFKFIGMSMKEALLSNWVTALIAVGLELTPLIQQTIQANQEMSKYLGLADQVYAKQHSKGMGVRTYGIGASGAAGAARAAAEINKIANQIAAATAREKGQAASEDKAYKDRLAKYIQHQKNVWNIKKAAWDAQQAANKSQAEADAKAAQEAAKQLAKDTITMRENLKKLRTIFSPQQIKADMGANEEAVVTGFNKISDFLSSAVNNGTLTKKAAGAFKAYASLESQMLRKIAAQRDKVQNKLDLARTLIGDTKKAIIDFGNITNTLGDTANAVTTSVSYIAGKFEVLVSASGKGAGGAQKIIDNLQSVVDKTREFGKNLKTLAKMGINTDLYNQILQAGVDTGGATAKALVEGGKTSVDALNATFDQLTSAADSVGKTAAEVMYGQGVNLTDGLINGLLAQDKKLKTAAQTLASAFSTAFNTTLNKTLGTGKTKVTFDKIDTSGLASGTAKQLLTNVGAAAGGANVTVTVNAGMGADGVAIGAEIVKVIKKYEKANGKVFSK